MAYDSIMVFPGKFKEHILPDKIHMLNVSFLVPSMRRNFGGCAGNIAYNVKLLGGKGAPMATVGHDFALYRARLEQLLTRRAILEQGEVGLTRGVLQAQGKFAFMPVSFGRGRGGFERIFGQPFQSGGIVHENR